jgi:hypothetical protein
VRISPRSPRACLRRCRRGPHRVGMIQFGCFIFSMMNGGSEQMMIPAAIVSHEVASDPRTWLPLGSAAALGIPRGDPTGPPPTPRIRATPQQPRGPRSRRPLPQDPVTRAPESMAQSVDRQQRVLRHRRDPTIRQPTRRQPRAADSGPDLYSTSSPQAHDGQPAGAGRPKHP